MRLDQFSSEMVILREEIKSLQTVKAALQLKISELEEEAKKNREELAERAKKQEEEDVRSTFLLSILKFVFTSYLQHTITSTNENIIFLLKKIHLLALVSIFD